MSEVDLSVREKKKELEELTDELQQKEKRVKDIRSKISELKEDIAVEQKKVLRGDQRAVFDEISEGGKMVIEECRGVGNFTVDMYAVKSGEIRYLGRRPKARRTRRRGRTRRRTSRRKNGVESGLLKFIKEELDPTDRHEHEGTLEHRVWKIQGGELKALRTLMEKRQLDHLYHQEGWKGIAKLAEDLRERCSRDCPAFEKEFTSRTGRKGSLRRRGRYDGKMLALREDILEYMGENDVTLREAVTALKLNDAQFAKTYERMMKSMEERLEKIEKAFGPYIEDLVSKEI